MKKNWLKQQVRMSSERRNLKFNLEQIGLLAPFLVETLTQRSTQWMQLMMNSIRELGIATTVRITLTTAMVFIENMVGICLTMIDEM